MFLSLALGYGCAAALGLAGALVFGGALWGWVVFVWLAGAPITIVVAGCRNWLSDLASRRMPTPAAGAKRDATMPR